MQLFADMARHASKYMSQDAKTTDVPASKKRKLEDSGAGLENENGSVAGPTTLVMTAPDTSFSIPQRKKLTLEINCAGTKNYGLSITNKGNAETYTADFGEIGMLSENSV